jgi:RNA recognition motif-containing protein
VSYLSIFENFKCFKLNCLINSNHLFSNFFQLCKSGESLKEKFNAYGEVGDVYIPRKFGSTEPRGFAFVRFLDKRDAEDAQRALDGTLLDGREIRIQEAKEKRPENPKEFMTSRF